ncbi:hypothetical protein MJN85_32660, partial [Salmonella enterica subsp. enterica serovar Anatum]|nr:hypothetical protein [Salmonella enterica subsp. enterica serovar Anatum]
FTDFTPQDAPTEVWGNHFTARVAPTAINQWLSGFFSRDVQLRLTTCGAWTAFTLLLLAFAILVSCFLTSDFSVVYVAQHSHS